MRYSGILIFAGTTEGRQLAEYCAGNKIPAVVSVMSEYGRMVLPDNHWLKIHTGALDVSGMEELMRCEDISMVIDATHPYAAAVSENITAACRNLGIERLRCIRASTSDCVRENAEPGYPNGKGRHWVSSLEEAVDFLDDTKGKLFITTGSRGLEAYTKLQDYEERVFARVLPDAEVLSQCRELGIRGRHIIGMQGPFSRELNEAMFRAVDASWLVTKEAGTAGGFLEKIQAADACDMGVVIIGRPSKEEGLSAEVIIERLLVWSQEHDGLPNPKAGRVSVVLAGIGMGGPGQLTMEAVWALESCQAVFGAGRMLEGVKPYVKGKHLINSYKPDEIIRWLKANPQVDRAVVAYSGDTGFFSGAAGMAKAICQKGGHYQIQLLPGISSVSYFFAKLGIAWEDGTFLSFHGREFKLPPRPQGDTKLFLLLDRSNTPAGVCQELINDGWIGATVAVGERLSYPRERIVIGTPEEIVKEEFEPLSVMAIIYNAAAKPCRNEEK